MSQLQSFLASGAKPTSQADASRLLDQARAYIKANPPKPLPIGAFTNEAKSSRPHAHTPLLDRLARDGPAAVFRELSGTKPATAPASKLRPDLQVVVDKARAKRAATAVKLEPLPATAAKPAAVATPTKPTPAAPKAQQSNELPTRNSNLSEFSDTSVMQVLTHPFFTSEEKARATAELSKRGVELRGNVFIKSKTMSEADRMKIKLARVRK